MFPSKFLQFPSILTHFHAANEKIQNGGRDLAISRGLVWVKSPLCFLHILEPAFLQLMCGLLTYWGLNNTDNILHVTFQKPFLNENYNACIQISSKFVPRDPIDNMSALVQIMAWYQIISTKPIPKPMMPMIITSWYDITRPQWVIMS